MGPQHGSRQPVAVASALAVRGQLAMAERSVATAEAPGSGDLLRHIGCSRGGLSAIFNTINRSKRSIVMNLAEKPGVELLYRFVRNADVFVQNFRPGVADKLGIGEAALRRARPDLIYVSISGFVALESKMFHYLPTAGEISLGYSHFLARHPPRRRNSG